MSLCICSLLILFLTLAGCAKEEETKIELPLEDAAQTETQLVPPPNAPAGAPPQERLHGAVHPQMTELLLKFEQQFGRMPSNIWDLSGRMIDSLPSAPPEMKYEIDPVDKAVKVVKQ